MMCSIIVLSALFLAGAGTALEDVDGALITPAPRVPRALINQDRVPLQKRQASTDDLLQPSDFCYGLESPEGICDFSNSLFEECQNLIGDYRQWNKCLCGNGAIAVSQRCDWCQEAFSMNGLGFNYTQLEQDATSACLSYGFSIAPVPASILAIESSYNATYTGTLPATTGKGPAVTRKLSSSASKETGTSKDNPDGVSTISYYSLNGGGGGSAVTSAPNSQSQPSSTSAQTTGAAPSISGWRAGDAALFSLVTLVMVTLLLM